jgi:hypothetical protein
MDMKMDLPARLRAVYWLGGGSGTGKSTIARLLAEAHGLTLYDTDAAMRDHSARCPPEECPQLYEFQQMSKDERWVNRLPETMLQTFHWFKGEGFRLIVEDLLHLTSDRIILAEGFRLLPPLVKPLLQSERHACWLLPTREFRRQAFDTRDLSGILGGTSDPDLARSNLEIRDGMFTEWLRVQTAELRLRAIEADGSMTKEQLCAQVAEHFAL